MDIQLFATVYLWYIYGYIDSIMFFYFRILFHLLAIFFLTIFQISFVQVLPGWIGETQLFLVLLIFILSLYGWKFAFFWAAVAGTLMDIYSFPLFGLYLISLLAATLFIRVLAYNFFTNRSLYSFLALTFFATLFYELFLRSLHYMIFLFQEGSPLFLGIPAFWISLGQEIVVNLGLMLIIFYVFNFVSNRFKSVFVN